jgi:four helix bundle protein
MRTFEDVDAWKAAKDLRNRVSIIVKDFPAHERFELVAALKRSSRQIAGQIAEGFGRLQYQENINACKQARGALFETLNHMLTAEDEGYVNAVVMEDFREQWSETVRLLNAYIAYIRRARAARIEGYDNNNQYESLNIYSQSEEEQD